MTLKSIQKELDAIKTRNKKVEADKAWETSWFRKGMIAVLTYGVIVLFFKVAEFPTPFLNAIVPTVGFVLSTLSIPFFRSFWVKNIYKE